MRFLIVGLGSMGKRRIRCLQALGFTNIVGFDRRLDRCEEARSRYGVSTFTDFDEAFCESQADALIISVPPDIHHEYMKIAIDNSLHFFVEASVLDTDMDWMKEAVQHKPIIAAPSLTLAFHPAVRKIGELVQNGSLGKISNIIHHSGQYLPDWHTYEKVSDFYVSNPLTGGAREIAPFELGWITHVFGFPGRVCGNVRKTITIEGAERIDDTYNFMLDYENFLATVTIDVVSRHAVRRLLINGDKRQLVWDWDAKCIRVYNPELSVWEEIPYRMEGAAVGYNPNIGENMYIDEIENFIQAIRGEKEFINTLERDHAVLKLLYAIEESDKKSQYIQVSL